MADDDDLPDADYESIYGYEAMRARIRARMDNIERSAERMIAEMRRRQEASEQPTSD